MKPSSTFFTIFFLFALTTTLPILPYVIADQFLRDTNGTLISPNNTYYIFPSVLNPDTAGGAELDRTDYTKCSVAVVLDNNFMFNSNIKRGLPVKLSTNNGRPLQRGVPIFIEFLTNLTCASGPTKWVMVRNNSTGESWVGIGGPEDHPGMEILDGYFTIFDKPLGGDVYPLLFRAYNHGRFLGIVDGGIGFSGWRLVGNDMPLSKPFKFVLAA